MEKIIFLQLIRADIFTDKELDSLTEEFWPQMTYAEKAEASHDLIARGVSHNLIRRLEGFPPREELD